MGGGQNKGLLNEEPCPFGIFREFTAVGVFLSGFNPSNDIER